MFPKRTFQDKGEVDLYVELPKLITSILFEAYYTFNFDEDIVEAMGDKIIDFVTKTTQGCVKLLNEDIDKKLSKEMKNNDCKRS